MARIAFKMKLFPGFEAEYKRRHDEIWPELKQLLKEAGVSDYSIFLDETTNDLFGVMDVEDAEKLKALPATEVMQRWWKQNVGVMATNEDHSPVQTPLKELFYLP